MPDDSPHRQHAPQPPLRLPAAAPDAPASAARAAATPSAVDRVVCQLGDGSCAQAHASALQRSPATAGGRQGDLKRLQRQFGNHYVGQVLHRARGGAGAGDTTVDEGIERSIEQARGAGQGLDARTRDQMEPAFGADFAAVRVHTDARADALNQALSARAFATGSDIFFRQGEYNPGASAGRELLAHELTHVVQQGGALRTKMALSQPGDPHELEADRVAQAVMQREQHPPQVPRDDDELDASGPGRGDAGGAVARRDDEAERA